MYPRYEDTLSVILKIIRGDSFFLVSLAIVVTSAVAGADLWEQGDTIRVRLQNEKGGDGGHLRVYNADGDKVADFTLMPEKIDDIFTDHPFFLSEEITDVPTGSGPGEIWKFVLSRYDNTRKQPSGNNWVRFSRNIPPYFSNDPDRLIYPIVHKEFKPITYCSVPGPPPKRQTYRVYLTVPRGAGSPIPPDGATQYQCQRHSYQCGSSQLQSRSRCGNSANCSHRGRRQPPGAGS